MLLPTIPGCALTLAARNVFGLGGDYSNGQTVSQPAWPDGMKDLANYKNRVAGLFVNAEDIFFFSGTALEFNAFLADYAKIRGIEKHRLTLHEGPGETGSLAGGNRRPCDWKLHGRPGPRRLGADLKRMSRAPDYDLEVHLWTGGKISRDQVVIPENVEAGNARAGANCVSNHL